MSNSWRGPKQDEAKALERGRLASPEPVAQQAAEVALTATPIAPAKPISVVHTPAPAAAPVKAAPKAQIEVRTHTDPPAKDRTKPRIDLTKVKAATTRAITWLGGITLSSVAFLRDQWQRLIRRVQGRWQGRSKGELPRQTVVIGFAALAVLILTIFWFTRDNDPAGTPLLSNTDAVKDANLTALQPVPPQPAPQPPARRTQTSQNAGTQPGITPPPTGVAPGQPRPKLSRLAIDPREKGKRFFTLASYSVTREEYMLPLLEFLWSQGVEAAAVQAHNSKNFAVVALQGFTRDEVNSKAHKQYEDTLRAIGKKWKAESGGDDNLQGLYLQEYAGTAAKLSITKAN